MGLCFQTFRLHPPHAPPQRRCFGSASGLAPDSPCRLSAILRTTLITRSLISRMWPYRVCVAGRFFARCSTDYLFTSSCSPRRVATPQLLSVLWREAPPGKDFHPPVRACSQAHERTTPSCQSIALPRRRDFSRDPKLNLNSHDGIVRSAIVVHPSR